MVPDKADAGVSGGDDGAVGKLAHDAGPVAESSVVLVIQILGAVVRDLQQTLSIGADPQAVEGIRENAADPYTVQLGGKLIFDLNTAGGIDDIKPVVRADIVLILPSGNGIHDAALHADGRVDILKGGLCQPQKAQTGGGEPEISLIVQKSIVDGIVEFIHVDPVKAVPLVKIGDTVVCGDKQFSVFQMIQIVDGIQSAAVYGAKLDKAAAGDIVAEDMVGGGTGQKNPVRPEAAAVEYFFVRKHQGALDLPAFHEKQTAVGGHGSDVSFGIGRRLIGIVDLAECGDLF